MIGVTEKAKHKLKNILKSKVDNPEAGVRLIYSEDSSEFGLHIDVEKKNDFVVEHEGVKVLIVDRDLGAQLDKNTLDVEEVAGEAELIIK